jgi:arginase
MPDFICIGAPYFLGQKLDQGTEVDQVHDSGIAREIGAAWVTIMPDYATHTTPVTAVNKALAEAILAHRDHFPIIFAADCTSALGAVKGLVSEAGLGVVWLDAHGDFNTPETSPSGFLGGMPLAMLVGRGEQNLMTGVGLQPLHEQDVILTDARDLDPGEAAALKASAVIHLPDVRDLQTFPLPDKPLYVHLDVDVINPDEMPAIRYAATGGPSLADTTAGLQRVVREGQVAGLLISLWNSDLATDKRPLQATLALVQAFVEAFPGF